MTDKTTEKLFTQNVYLRGCESTVLQLTNYDRGSSRPPASAVILDQTIFFPEGGGQSCDLGTINGIPVSEVASQDGIIYHILEDEGHHGGGCAPSAIQLLKEGQRVTLSIDWQRRFRNMQRHCGEHILSGIFFRELGGINRGFHMGDLYMTIDIDLPEITWEQAVAIERQANEVIWANKPVITRYFENSADAEKLPLRKPLALDEDITIVCVGDVENPADCVACCGTHPAFAGEVGLIKILKLEKYKGMMRIYLTAGQDAFADYSAKHELITKLNKKYSADEGDLLDKIKIQDEKNKAVRQELHELKSSVIASFAERLCGEYEQMLASDKKVPILSREYPDLKVDDILTVGRKAAGSIKGLLILIAPKENTALLFSGGSPDCGKLVKENAPIYNGKGGGNANSARALFTKREYLDTFIDLLGKHLR